MSNAHMSDASAHGEDLFGPGADEPEPIDITPEPGRDEPRKRPASRRRRAILAAVMAVGLAGVGAIGAAGWRVLRQVNTSLAVPADVAGLTRDSSNRAQETADYLRTAFTANLGLEHSIAAVYDDPFDANRRVLIFGGTALLWRPERELDRLFKQVNDGTGTVASLQSYPSGQFGGVLKCGNTTSADGDMAVCGWADHGSLVLAMFPGRAATDSATLLRRMRDEVQARG